ncbi:hypothetical protein KC921_00685 [Candidatus Woesebacteria bacterium]|nr:hypothetical protein [Candidatus Woesebacteria bacterium]
MKQKIALSVFAVFSAIVLFSPFRVFAQFGDGIVAPFDSNNAYVKDIQNPATADTNAFTTFELIISNVLALLTVLGSLVFIIYFLLGAISWISSGGDTSKVGKARDQMLQGVLGLVVLVIMYAVVGLIGSIVGIDILNPAKVLGTLVP